jgi:cell division protein FtsB|tara:strand:- start:9679 stop:10026 length:348 start_codon:yes stop_codon:yes gene_type:complete
MFWVIKLLKKTFNGKIKFYLLASMLALVVFMTQFNYWFGDYNRSDLNSMKEEIVLISKENEQLLVENKLLEEERNKLSSGREAIEGLARSELGLIKPGETFYVFKDAKEESPQNN